MFDALRILGFYFRARRLQRFTDRVALLEHQKHAFARLQTALRGSAFYRPYLARPWSEWPIVDKAAWMANFDAINTVGVRRTDAEQVAVRAEGDRNFDADLDGITVGLSTGTSGARGVFLASAAERQQWAGAVLAKLLPRGLRQRERVALVLRADSRLYGTVATVRWLRFGYFDSTRSLQMLARELREFRPTILVGPPSVLRALASDRDLIEHLKLRRVVSGAEVLEDDDRRVFQQAFRTPIAQIYQATEGFLGATCTHGRLHLNEEYVRIEPQWLDAKRRRFVPIVTDLYRYAQPVVRYRLNDVLTMAGEPCGCGSASVCIERIEGREDDVFWSPSRTQATQSVPVFADALSRSVISASAELEDYEIVQTQRNLWRIAMRPVPNASDLEALRERLRDCALRAGATAPDLEFAALDPPSSRLHKRRRVRRDWREADVHA